MDNIFFKYPVINDNIIVKISPESIIFFLKDVKKRINISKDFWELYRRFEGKQTLLTIYNELSEDWKIDKEEFESFIHDAQERKLIDLSDRPKLKEISIIGNSNTYYPTMISVELTNKCNIKCVYCYGDYQPQRKDIIEFEKLKELFLFFQLNGAVLLEITGGEPLLHPRFNEVCELALECFSAITILSNGTLFKEEHFEIIRNNINRISLQISIDGISEKTNTIVRGVPNTWERTLSTLIRLIDMKAKLRIIYMLTKTNVFELESACVLMRSLGVKTSLIISPVMNIGRGHYSGCSVMDHIKLDDEYILSLEKLGSKYLDVIHTIPEEIEKSPYFSKVEQKNCGAGWKMIGISADGNVKACHLLGEYGIIGNIYKDNYESIFTSDIVINFFQKFRKETVDERCESCFYKFTCARCIFKVFEANKMLISQGKDLCPVAKQNKMDLYLSFSVPGK